MEQIKQKGLYRKYIVRKADTGEEVANCFILRPEKDPAAVAALREYARVTNNRELASDILRWICPTHFTQNEVEDAKAIIRLFPHLIDRIVRFSDGEIWAAGSNGVYRPIATALFPSILPGQTFKLSDIIGGNNKTY